MKILALSGSLRKLSYNTALLKAMKKLAPSGMEVDVFEGMGKLPPFNPDVPEEEVSQVMVLKAALANAQGLFIASPEYAHGISGVMKNALDWLVSGEEFVSMPVAILNTSPRSSHAIAALREVTQTMSGVIIEGASISIPLLGSNLDEDGIVRHPVISKSLVDAMANFMVGVEQLYGKSC
ncbi:NADPH-dependent FMN reductase [Kangiella sp. M94]